MRQLTVYVDEITTEFPPIRKSRFYEISSQMTSSVSFDIISIIRDSFDRPICQDCWKPRDKVLPRQAVKDTIKKFGSDTRCLRHMVSYSSPLRYMCLIRVLQDTCVLHRIFLVIKMIQNGTFIITVLLALSVTPYK